MRPARRQAWRSPRQAASRLARALADVPGASTRALGRLCLVGGADPLALADCARHHAPLVLDAGSEALGGSPAALADASVLVVSRASEPALAAGGRRMHRARGAGPADRPQRRARWGARGAGATAFAHGRPARAGRPRAAWRARPCGGAPRRPGPGGAVASLAVSYGATARGQREPWRPASRWGWPAAAPQARRNRRLRAPPLVLHGPRLVATGAGIALSGRGAVARQRIRIELRIRSRWARVAAPVANRRGRFAKRFAPRRARRVYVLRARAGDGRVSRTLRVRSRDLRLAAVGDVNLGDGPGDVMAAARTRLPLDRGGAGPPPRGHRLREPRVRGLGARGAGAEALQLPRPSGRAQGDGAPHRVRRAQPRQQPRRRLRPDGAARHGPPRQASGIAAVGAGGSLASASRPRVVRRLGLRVAFVGFSDILPALFYAGPRQAGTQPASLPAIRAGVRRARRRADVVIATFHWGVERAPGENERQRGFAAAALGAGAAAVIGAHPHVLQPVRRARPPAGGLQPRELRLLSRVARHHEDRHPQAEAVRARRGGRPAPPGRDREHLPAPAGLAE